MSKNVVEPEATNDDTIWRKSFACWISKATCTHVHAHAHALGYTHAHTHTQIYNMSCFSTATMIRERASVLRHTHIVCVGLFYGS